MRFFFAGKVAVGQSASNNLLHDDGEPLGISQLAFVKTKALFIRVRLQVVRLNRYVRALQGALEQTPKVLKTVGVNLSIDITYGVVDHFVRKFSLAMNKHIVRVSPTAMNQLQQLPWMGNVRELENAVERAMVVAKPQSAPTATDKTLDQVERAHILRVLEECGNNQSRTAEMLGIDRVTLHHKLKRYGWSRTPVETR